MCLDEKEGRREGGRKGGRREKEGRKKEKKRKKKEAGKEGRKNMKLLVLFYQNFWKINNSSCFVLFCNMPYKRSELILLFFFFLSF